MIRGSNNRGFVTESWEPATPIQSNNNRSIIEDEFSPNEMSPGLLDLHSFDTDLLPKVIES
jgi:kinesin family member 2/24